MTIRETGIPWATHAWPVYVGCKRNCRIETHGFECYAKRNFPRYRHCYPEMGGKFENVTFIEKNFNMTFPKKPGARIFINPSSDPEYWEDKYIDLIVKKIRENPQHSFLILTKCISLYWKWVFVFGELKNLWCGITVNDIPGINEYNKIEFAIENIKFLSLEPIREEIPIQLFNPDLIDWLIIGGQSGPGEKFYPKKSWYLKLIKYCKNNKIAVFVKPNLLVDDDVNYNGGVIVRPSLTQEYPEVGR